jgi:hypothetical protein
MNPPPVHYLLTFDNRSDIEYSLHFGTPTRFTAEDFMHLGRQHEDSTTTTSTLPNLPLLTATTHNLYQWQHLRLSSALATLLHDATLIAHLLQAASTPGPDQQTNTKLPSSAVHETFILLAYRLQAISPLVSGRVRHAHTNYVYIYPAVTDAESTVERAVCLGLTAFVASFFWGGGCGSLPKRGSLEWIEEGVKGVFSSFGGMDTGGMQGVGSFGGGVGEGDKEVMLWMLFVGVAAGVLGGGDMDGWVAVKTGEMMRSLGLCDWESVARVLEKFPWIEVLHGRKGRAHWERCKGLCRSC